MSPIRRHKHSRKRSLSKTAKIYGGVAAACFLVGALLFFLSERGPQLLQEKMSDTMMTQAEQMLGRKLTPQDAALIEKRFGVKLDFSGSGGQRGIPGAEPQASPGGVSRGQESAGDAASAQGKLFKERELLEMVDRYGGGKVNQADIEKAKRALREQR